MATFAGWLRDPGTPVRRVVIVGGTHGNEATGVAVARALARRPPAPRTFAVDVVLANAAAMARNARYVEEDMNRCFGAAALAAPPATVDARRARELNARIGPKGSASAADLVIDLHNTTSASGVALMMHRDDALSHAIGAHLLPRAPRGSAPRRVCEWSDAADHPMLPSVGKAGFTLEVGPVSWGVVDAALFRDTLACVREALEYVDRRNEALDRGGGARPETSPTPLPVEYTLPVFRRGEAVPYPRGADGAPTAFAHPALRDFEAVAPGAPLFVDEAGRDVGAFDADAGDTVYFVNEAAYYEKDIAFCYASKHTVGVDVLPETPAAPV